MDNRRKTVRRPKSTSVLAHTGDGPNHATGSGGAAGVAEPRDRDAALATKRPRQRRKDARPAEIIDAGLQEFAANGFAGARLEDVAARAGVVKGTIYRYFGSKEALFDAALKSRITPIFERIGELIDLYPGPTPDLLRMVLPQVYRELFASDAHILVRIIISEGGRFPAIAKLYFDQAISKGQALTGKIIQRGIVRGEFRDGPVADLPFVIVAPAIMAVVWKMTFERFDPIAIDSFVAAHVDLVLKGLEVRD